MAHDSNSEEVKVGDLVNVPCRVIELHPNENYHDAVLETNLPLPPENVAYQTFVVNTRQLVKSK